MKLGPRIIGIAGGLSLLLSGPALAQETLDFEDRPGPYCNDIATFPTPPLTYAGFEWSTDWGACTVAAIDGFGLNSTGTQNGISSGLVGIFNRAGRTVSVTRSTPFNFVSAHFNPLWRDGMEITISGYLGATLLFNRILTLDASNAGQLENFNWVVDKLEFSSAVGSGAVATDGGFPYRSNCANLENNCTEFIMDDFTYSSVPEPMSFALTGTGLLGLALFHRRRKRRLDG